MGLLIKLQNGDTALKSLKFGHDRPGGGDSGQPYIKTPIDKPNTPVLNSDFLLRGGISAPLTALEDVARLTKYFFDFKNPGGLLFTAKQNLLSRVSPKTEASFGLAYGGLTNNINPTTGNISPNQNGGFFNGGIYNPLSTIAEAGVVAFGGHLNKQGIDPTGIIPFLSIRKYGDIVFENNQLEKNEVDPTVPLALWRKSQNASNKAGRKLAQANNQSFKTKNELAVNVSLPNTGFNEFGANKNSFTQSKLNKFLEKWDAFRDKQAIKKLNRKDNAASRALDRQAELFQQVQNAENAPKTYANRLLKLWNSSGLNLQNPSNASEPILFSYGGGPDSILGVGNTNIRFATLNDGSTPARTNNTIYEDSKPQISYSTSNIFGDENSSVSLKYASLNTSISDYNLFGVPNFLETNNGTPLDRLGIATNPKSNIGNGDYYSSQFSTWGDSDFINQSDINILSETKEDFRTILQSDYTKTFSGTPYTLGNDIEYLFNLGNPGQKGDLSNTKRGKAIFGNYYTLDTVNASYIYKSATGKPRDDASLYDLIPFRIAVLNNEKQEGGVYRKYMHFRAFINGFSDSYGADWEKISYMGRAEKFYKYNGFNRDISIGFTIVAQSVQELTPMYDKLNFLASSLAPEYLDASTSGYMAGNIAYITVGDYLNEQPGIITSLDFEIPDDTTWEVATERDGTIDTTTRELRRLPHRIEVKMKFTPIHEFRPQKQTFQEDKKNKTSTRLLKPGRAKYIDQLRPETTNYDKEGGNVVDSSQETFDIPAQTPEEQNILPIEQPYQVQPAITDSSALTSNQGTEVTGLGGGALNNSFNTNTIFPR
jgi:hypothetical protein